MESLTRRPFQGILNIIRFNWHYYVIAFVVVSILIFIKRFLPYSFLFFIWLIIFVIIISIIISLAVSFYIYDFSDLYSLIWLNFLEVNSNTQLVNINAGFDETSSLLKNKYPRATLTVFDFYDAKKHTEISIERARKAYAIFPGTININTDEIFLKPDSVDYIFLILSAHEIRNDKERTLFFTTLKNSLKPEGRIIVAEHQRDFFNFIAYNIGYLHFFSTKTWYKTFAGAGLIKESMHKVTPFISVFILKRNGTAS